MENLGRGGQPVKQEPQFTVLSDIVRLPSKGQFYENGVSELVVEYMTAKDENILTAPNLLASGKVFDYLMKRKIKNKDIDVDSLLQGDINKILIFLRKTGYGADYQVKVQDPITKERFTATIDLELLQDKEIKIQPNEKREFSYTLPLCKKQVSFRLLNNREKETVIKNAEDYQKKLNMDIPILLTDLLKAFITDIDGNSDRMYISNFVENMTPKDASSLRKFIAEVEPGVDMNYEFTSPSGNRFQAPIEFGLDFFWMEYGN